MVRADDRRNPVRESDLFQDAGADHRVDLHPVELLRGQLARFRNDVIRHRKLADIVKDGRRLQRLNLVGTEPQMRGGLERVDLHAPQMIVRAFVLGLDRHGQRLDGSQVQRGHALGMALLLFDSCDDHLVRPVHHV